MKNIKLNELTMDEKSKIEIKINAACGIITKLDENGNNQVLLIQRAKDDHYPLMWELPRGKCDKGKHEDTIKCLKREIKEETGLDVKVEKFLGTFEYVADKGTRLTVCYNYLCSIKNPNQKIKLSKEHQDYKWINQLGQATLMILPDQLKFLEKVLSIDNSISQTPETDFTKNNMIEEYSKKYQNGGNNIMKRINKAYQILEQKISEIENSIDNIPNQDIEQQASDVIDDLTKDEEQKIRVNTE